MELVWAALWAAAVATAWVSEWGQDFRDRVLGRGMPHHERRMQSRRHDHEYRMAALAQSHERLMVSGKYRHEQRMAGKAGPKITEAVAGRIQRGPTRYEDLSGIRRWWFDLCADHAERLTRNRRERYARVDAGEAWWQRLIAAAEQRWRERHAGRDPHRPWVDSERADTDWPDPGAADPGVVDVEVVAETADTEPQVRPQTPVPDPESIVDPEPDTETPGEHPAGQSAEPTDQGVIMAAPAAIGISGDTVDPQTGLMFAQGIGDVAQALAAEIEASVANLTARGVSGEPIDDLAQMLDAAQILLGRATSAAGHFQSHIQIQDVAHADSTVGGEEYLGIGAAAHAA